MFKHEGCPALEWLAHVVMGIVFA